MATQIQTKAHELEFMQLWNCVKPINIGEIASTWPRISTFEVAGNASAMKQSSQATVNELLAGSSGGAAQVLKGPMNILKQTIRNEESFALYKEMASPLLGIAGVNSLLFASYGISKRIISPFPQLSLKEIALAGSMAGAANAILASPVVLRLESACVEIFEYGAATDKRLSGVVSEMWRDWGFRKGIMRSDCSTRDTRIRWICKSKPCQSILLRVLVCLTGILLSKHPYFAFKLTTILTAFEFSKRQFSQKYDAELPVWALVASGSTGGFAYWLACHPLDVVKSPIQLRGTPPSGTPVQYIAHEIKTIIQESGVYASGWSDFLSSSIPAAASTFAAFELTRDYLEKATCV
ncbi:LOW QUALITY PROTEIN: hypothetical protein CVT25_008011 [Psilocybe cyanescens]|uniref:Uncharacterized protein n=1 Tax=Psilocybe cyanescens TaxID=93625 RepID=A0A409X9X9_PSICY|nr:LOW QUALITY PROTEIN: hypothetical protein CVT25_008011 [Psilocybe cyanescens]